MGDILGHLDFETNERFFIELAKIGELDDLIIYVRMNDAVSVPHFHIVDRDTLGKHFQVCVKIETTEYLYDFDKGSLNSNQKERLVELLNSNNSPKCTNWEYLIMTWNANNSKSKISKKISMPNYLEL